MNKIIKRGILGLLFGLIIGGIFIAFFTSLLNNANAYNDFVREVPFGFLRIIAVCALVPMAIFMKIPDDDTWKIRITISLAILAIILVITFISLVISTYEIANIFLTVILIAALLCGGEKILVIIIHK